MTVVANLEDDLVLHRDFERVDASERPRTQREARLEEVRELDGKLGAPCGSRSRRRRSSLARSGRWPTAGSTAASDTRGFRHTRRPCSAFPAGRRRRSSSSRASSITSRGSARGSRRGDIPRTKVRTVTRAATPESEEPWIGRALVLTSPGLKIAVAQANGEEPEFTLTVRLKGAELADVEEGLRRIREERAEAVALGPAAAKLARRALGSPAARPPVENRDPRVPTVQGGGARDARGSGSGLARGAFGGEGGRGDPRSARGAPAAREDDSPARARDRARPRPQPLPDLRLEHVEGEFTTSIRGATTPMR